MDIGAALAVASKGISLLNQVLEAGKDVAPVIRDLNNVFGGENEPTDAQISELEDRLDAQLDEFNSDLPDSTA